MANNIIGIERLGALGVLRQGTRHYTIRNGADLPDSMGVKIQKWINIKTEDLNEQDIIYIDKKHYNEDVCITKGDIVFTTFPTLNTQNIAYIDKTLEEYIYGETMYIFRANRDIDNEYIFAILDSGLYNRFINRYIKKFKVSSKFKLTHEMILNISIPIFDEATQKEIIQEHRKLLEENRKSKDLEKKIKERKDNYNKQLFQQIQNSINI